MIKLVDVKYLPEKDVYEISKESIIKSNTEFRMMKLQRDELINDIADIKRKAEAFDEIKELVNWFDEIEPYEFKAQVVRIKRIINNLERGSDDNRN